MLGNTRQGQKMESEIINYNERSEGSTHKNGEMGSGEHGRMTGVSERRSSTGDLDELSEMANKVSKEMEGEVVRNTSILSTSSGSWCLHGDMQQASKKHNTGS